MRGCDRCIRAPHHENRRRRLDSRILNVIDSADSGSILSRARPLPRRAVMKPTLVTGANGHLGNNLCRQLVARGERVRAMPPSSHTEAIARS